VEHRTLAGSGLSGGSLVYYFYVCDEEFGPWSVKISAYFPYPIMV
jgi:hypothetical protein